MDLSRVTLPTFVLEPRSFLEKLTDFLSHSDLLLRVSDNDDPLQRVLAVTKWYLSGWHVRPKGVKKPYNPILGELFRCKIDNGPDGFTNYVAEQVSHHPPVSVFYVENRKKNISFYGSLVPRSRFLGNSAASLMEGTSWLKLLNYDEEYEMNFPNVYARGIIIGSLLMETGGNVSIKCEKSGYVTDIEFKVKGWWGEYDKIGGTVRRIGSDEALYTLDGYWSSVINITNCKTNETSVFFDSKTSPSMSKIVPPEDQELEYESRRMWTNVTKALAANDLDAATAAKTELEEEQRKTTKERHDLGQYPQHRLFFLHPNGRWTYRYSKFTVYEPGVPEQNDLDEVFAALPRNIGRMIQGGPQPDPAEPCSPSPASSPPPDTNPPFQEQPVAVGS